MPTLDAHRSHTASRVLLVGDPGGGKTMACASLARVFKRVFYLDLDDGLDAAVQLLPPDALRRIHYVTARDKVNFKSVDGKIVPVVDGVPEAFPAVCRLLNRWRDPETGEDFGSTEEWGPDDCLVLDGLTPLGQAAMWHTLYANKRMGRLRRMKDWGNAIERVEGIVQALNSTLPCSVVMTAHLSRLGVDDNEDDEEVAGQPKRKKSGAKSSENLYMRYPAVYGRKLPPTIGGYFNVVLQAKRVGHGQNAQRVLLTTPEPDVDVKVPVAPKALPVEVANDKLGEIIKLLQGKRKEV